jgi:hypothetical protein
MWAMLLKQRTVPIKLMLMRSLNARKELSKEERNYCSRLEKGYQGEVLFDGFTEKLKSDFLIINDLGLEFSNNFFQLDTVIVSQDIVFLFEVKNLEGDFIYEEDGFKTLTAKKDIQNPLEQLKRSKIYFGQLLHHLGIRLHIEGFVVFINPEFTLYQSPVKAPIIFPTQLNRFMNKFDVRPSKLNSGHRKFAEQLVSMHQTKSPYEILPVYSFDHLQKGVLCPNCHCFLLCLGERKSKCHICGYVVNNEALILEHVEELRLLFPDNRLTTNYVSDWLNGEISKKQICRVLKENFKLIGSGKWAYYE